MTPDDRRTFWLGLAIVVLFVLGIGLAQGLIGL